MTAFKSGSIAERAWGMIDNVPTTISGTVMQNYVEQAAIDVQNYTGETVSLTSVPIKYQNILINLTAAYTLMRISSVGTDKNWKLGDFSIDAPRDNPAIIQAENHLKMAEEGLKRIGRRMPFYKALG